MALHTGLGTRQQTYSLRNAHKKWCSPMAIPRDEDWDALFVLDPEWDDAEEDLERLVQANARA